MTPHGKLILVPKAIVRRRMLYDLQEYYNHYILVELQHQELNAKSELVQLLKNGKERVTKKSLREKYGQSKPFVIQETLKNPRLLREYRADKRTIYPRPLNHCELATVEEREAIIAGFHRNAPHYVNYVICGFWTGWHPNEACALKWPRVDFNQGKILIREGRVLGQTGIPKAARSLRDIDMLPPVKDALAAQKALSWLLGGYVFLGGKQQPMNQELFRMKAWEPVLKRSGVRYRPPYQMRHSFATLAISAGENINWVARMLGHKSPVVTLEKYNR
jgi:integrase